MKREHHKRFIRCHTQPIFFPIGYINVSFEIQHRVIENVSHQHNCFLICETNIGWIAGRLALQTKKINTVEKNRRRKGKGKNN